MCSTCLARPLSISLSILGLVLVCCTLHPTAVEALPKEATTNARCGQQDGTREPSSYRQAVPVPGTHHFLPIYSSVDLAQSQVSRLLVIVHGIGGNAHTFFCDALAAVPSSVGVVAPWFGHEGVRLQEWAGSAAAAGDHTSLFWSGGEWNQGATAANAGTVSSFAALDALLAAVGSSSRLQQVTVAGFSAGAQMVQRYAWATPYGAPGSPSPAVKFVVSDPSTFLYFDDKRADASCRPPQDTGSSWTCSKFSRPSDADSCPEFNSYKLGLDGLAQSGGPYLAQPRITSNPRALSEAYLQKSILYVFGGADTCNCNTPGYLNPASCIRDAASSCGPSAAGPRCCDMPAGKAKNSFVDVSCGEMMQGSNRLQRGLLYRDYLRTFSGFRHTPQVVVVPGMGHDQVPMLNAPEFISFVSS